MNSLIVFEGIDGCGKTTQAKRLVEKLKKFYTTYSDSEPTKTGVGKFLREEVLSGKTPLPTKVIARLFAADREAHLEVVRERKDSFTVCDRYIASNVAYQGQDDLQMREYILKQNEGFERPGITFYLRVKEEDVSKVFERVCKRGDPKEIFDQVETQQKLAKTFDELLINNTPEFTRNLYVIDALKTEEEIAEEVWKIFLGENNVE